MRRSSVGWLTTTFRDTFSESANINGGRLFGQSVLLGIFVLVLGIASAIEPKVPDSRSWSFAFAGAGALILLSMPFAYASPKASLRVSFLQGTAVLLLVVLTGVTSLDHLLLRESGRIGFCPGLFTWTSAHGGNQSSLAIPNEAAARGLRRSAFAGGLLLDVVVTTLCVRALLAG